MNLKYGDITQDLKEILKFSSAGMIDSAVSGLSLVKRIDANIYLCVDKKEFNECRSATMLEN